jgi:hypothetical protein
MLLAHPTGEAQSNSFNDLGWQTDPKHKQKRSRDRSRMANHSRLLQ